MGSDDVDSLLALLPDGARILSTVLPHQTPTGHVYRVVSGSGSLVGEFSTLVELSSFLDHYTTAYRTR